MDSIFNDEQIANIKELFTLFDKDDDGWVEIKHLGTMIRGLGYFLTNVDVNDLQNQIDPNKIGNFDFPEFLTVLASLNKLNNHEDELAETLKKMADKDDLLQIGQLRYILKGEKEELVDHLIKDIKLMKSYDEEKDKISFYELLDVLLFKYNNIF